MKNVKVKNFTIGNNEPLTVMAGPCVIEGEEHCFETAHQLKDIFRNYPIQFIFKSSYDKANRTSVNSYRGPGIEEGLRILKLIKMELDLPIVSDVHTPEEVIYASQILDLLQIPAFLCRQTDLIVAAGNSKIPVSVKKGQFVSPWDMKNVVEKIQSTGNDQIILVDRGTSFGYNNLVSDMRSIPIMQKLGYPVCFDATHSVQLPGGLGSTSGGQREFIPTLAKAAVASGANSIFIETHPNPSQAMSDAGSQLRMEELPRLLDTLVKIYEVVRND